ncbi:hypothetical protein [Planktothrix sp. FACHB-1365]|uniref:hypothetical protein n=1 Tax=Planktothrix sp. FACHB-1365 TaxID=2692855 RepID=UPI00168776EB|nr:hypothetical protein [Planktothrix sp. FACHB-1365]MBD2482822.1 hypothetical protein [Planktothrix sp. FACHB-1365]
MTSIVLSFVGNQDPFSDQTTEEGSIVTLIRYLMAEKNTINRVILLHTAETQERAEATKDWLKDEPLNLSLDQIDIIPVEDILSQDPVNLLAAVQEARKGLDLAKQYLQKGDHLEFNASSGTPVMKSAWSILQAAGYAPHSSVWQVRNPKQMQSGQPRVFSTNVEVLKNEFDLKVIQQQILDYNYSGALATVKVSNLSTELIEALLKYADYRMAFDFDLAFTAIQPWKSDLESQWISEISSLRQKNKPALLKEVYFKAFMKLKNQQYADFLVDVFRFQEGFLRFVVEETLKVKLPKKRSEIDQFWATLKRIEGGRFYKSLENYRLPNGKSLDLNGFMSRLIMMIILEISPQFCPLYSQIETLNEYCEQRNQFIHDFEGISEIDEPEKVKKNMRELLQVITHVPKINPYDILNQKIFNLLESRVKN